MFYGAEVSKMEANRIGDLIRLTYPRQEIEVKEGGQPHYPIIFSIE
jgi:dihydroxyacetone kinase-like predicted kinase